MHSSATKPEPLVYTVEEAAAVTTLGRSTIKQQIADGKLRVIRVGRRVLIPRQSLEDFLAR
jgi:excisionase family DNA binding protein